MKKRFGGALLSLAGLVGSVVVPMMWPTISPAYGWAILTACATGVLIGLALMFWSWLYAGQTGGPNGSGNIDVRIRGDKNRVGDIGHRGGQ